MTALPRGIGTEQEINQANQWMREQPWYQQLLQGWGQTGAVHLEDWQRNQIMNEARMRGVGISDRMEIDPAGNINPKGHKLRNTLIAAGIGAGVAAPFIIPALAAGGAGGGAAAGVGLGETAATTGLASGAGIGGAVAAPAFGAAGAASAAGAAGGGAGGAGTAATAGGASALERVIKMATPAVGYGLSKAFGGSNAGSGPNLSPDQQAMLSNLLSLQYDRAARQAPLHQAAMAMATRMAPRYARDAMGPMPTPSMPTSPSGLDPDVTRAIEALSRSRQV